MALRQKRASDYQRRVRTLTNLPSREENQDGRWRTTNLIVPPLPRRRLPETAAAWWRPASAARPQRLLFILSLTFDSGWFFQSQMLLLTDNAPGMISSAGRVHFYITSLNHASQTGGARAKSDCRIIPCSQSELDCQTAFKIKVDAAFADTEWLQIRLPVWWKHLQQGGSRGCKRIIQISPKDGKLVQKQKNISN